jgi:hypothetical protein
MPVTKEGPAPYGPPKAILDLVQRHRNKGLPSPVDADVLARSGVPDSLIPRTLQSLKILDLIEADGTVSETLERIRLAPESEYQLRLSEWLNAAYADALAYIDPATAQEVDIRDAFRKYVPTGQQSRMVTLFIGLFAAAGVRADRQRPPSPAKPSSNGVAAKPRLVTASVSPRARVRQSPPPPNGQAMSGGGMGLPAALTGLLASLPADGDGWTQDRRDKFLTAFPVILDFCYPVRPDQPAKGEHDNGDTD